MRELKERGNKAKEARRNPLISGPLPANTRNATFVLFRATVFYWLTIPYFNFTKNALFFEPFEAFWVVSVLFAVKL